MHRISREPRTPFSKLIPFSTITLVCTVCSHVSVKPVFLVAKLCSVLWLNQTEIWTRSANFCFNSCYLSNCRIVATLPQIWLFLLYKWKHLHLATIYQRYCSRAHHLCVLFQPSGMNQFTEMPHTAASAISSQSPASEASVHCGKISKSLVILHFGIKSKQSELSGYLGSDNGSEIMMNL